MYMENPPIYPGETKAVAGFEAFLGKKFIYQDVLWNGTGGTKVPRSNNIVTRVLVKNDSGFAVLPKRLVTLRATAAGLLGQSITGYADTTAEAHAYPVDEFLPAAGCADGAMCYIVIEGPALCLTDLAGGANNLLPLDTILVSLTGATSGATTSGRVAPQDLTGATAVLVGQARNAIGRGLTARTTANTTADILVYMMNPSRL